MVNRLFCNCWFPVFGPTLYCLFSLQLFIFLFLHYALRFFSPGVLSKYVFVSNVRLSMDFQCPLCAAGRIFLTFSKSFVLGKIPVGSLMLCEICTQLSKKISVFFSMDLGPNGMFSRYKAQSKPPITFELSFLVI